MNHPPEWHERNAKRCEAVFAQLEGTPSLADVEAARAFLDAHARQERAQGGLSFQDAA